MIVIREIHIMHFRSILNLKVKVDDSLNLITICGENNVGKTNLLRAIELFFKPELYDYQVDRPVLKSAQGGSRIDTKITIKFYNKDTKEYHEITRDYKVGASETEALSGTSFSMENGRKKSTQQLKVKTLNYFINSIEFCYIESINIDIPKLVENLTNEVIDVEYEKARFNESKMQLKKAFDEYSSGLQSILDVFSNKISNTFNMFRSNWDIKFTVPQTSDTFRSLISKDVELLIDDKGCLAVEQKGSGLQRLALILLNFEIMIRMKKIKNFIVCIDEPDIYLHDALQKKLYEFLAEKSQCNFQIFFTTHSNIFINSYLMKNIFLLAAKHEQKYSARKKKNINVIETYIVDMDEDGGYDKICQHLGIEANHYEILKKNNILVEGGCDKKYIEELCRYFNLETPHIISMNGASNTQKFLDFYNAYYKDNTLKYIPTVKVLLDNDQAGRDEFNKIKVSKYRFIKVVPSLLPNHLTAHTQVTADNAINHEIEDLVYPEIICYLVNRLLVEKNYNKISQGEILKNLCNAAFARKGILELIEHEKIKQNPDLLDFSLTSSGKASNAIKEGLAGIFSIRGDRKLIDMLTTCDEKYPQVRETLKNLIKFS